MKPIQAKELLQKYVDGKCTEQERRLFEAWYDQLNEADRVKLSASILAQVEVEMQQVLSEKIGTKKRVTLWPRVAAAAVVFLIAGYWFITNKSTLPDTGEISQAKIEPGGNKAILTLSNGKQISLDDAQQGTLTQEGSQLVKKNADGSISYGHAEPTTQSETIGYNAVTTPRGGQWSVVLSDGTKVYLDATSSIKYPVKFTGNQRLVEVTGQVYFEVAHNAKKPFIVKANNQQISVLGTHFNINIYDDEPTSAITLLEGSINVTKGKNTALLKLNQQAVSADNSSLITVKNVDAANFIAWKTGRFYFNKADIKSVMRQLARWYDVEVSFKGELPQQQFNGDIQRSLPAAQLLDILSNYYNVPFKTEGKKIIVGQY